MRVLRGLLLATTVSAFAFAACAPPDEGPSVDEAFATGEPALDEGPELDQVAEGDEEVASEQEALQGVGLTELPGGCADPGVLHDGATYYIVCTGEGAGGAFRIHTSTDLRTWKETDSYIFPAAGDAGTTVANHPWLNRRFKDDHGNVEHNFWAPEIHIAGDPKAKKKRYVAYYVASSNASGKNSVGAAWADSPLGPFHDLGVPIVPNDQDGFIDPNYYFDGKKGHLYWKRDHNFADTTIYEQEVSADGLHRVGAPRHALEFGEPWERKLVEAPWVIHHGSYYYMFYSGALYCTDHYAIGVARARSPEGPFTEHKFGHALIRSGARWISPGHNSVVTGHDGILRIIYHAYDANEGGPSCQPGEGSGRHAFVRALHFDDGWPVLGPPPSANERHECAVRCCGGKRHLTGHLTEAECFATTYNHCDGGKATLRTRWDGRVIFGNLNDDSYCPAKTN